MVSSLVPEVVSVKLDPDMLLTVPTAPPAAGPDRALDPWAPDPKWPAAAGALLAAAGALLAAAELLLEELEEQATTPKAPPPITIPAIPAVMTLPGLLENIILTPYHRSC
jgi:hypothetical protein